MVKRSSGSSARGGRAARKGRRTVGSRKIDYSDIPEASDAQLRTIRRVGRPPVGNSAKQLIAIRVDPDVLSSVRRRSG